MKFRAFCSLLADLEKIISHDPPFPAQLRKDKIYKVIDAWFSANRRAIDASEEVSTALLSAFFPKWRSDRVFGFQPASLSKAIGRCLWLGASRQRDLERWKQGAGDLGLCVERVMADEYSGAVQREVTLEEIDEALENLARRSRFSAPTIRSRGPRTDASTVNSILERTYRCLSPQEAKIFTRMILKDYRPVELPQNDILRCFHHLMPVVLKVYDNFEEAVKVLQGPHLQNLVAMPDPRHRALQREVASLRLAPKVGIKVGRPTFLKARSIRHTTQLANGRVMSLERKYDGEYCQIHINVKSFGSEIQIFSKSGKDGTMDRIGVHNAIKECLRIGRSDCPIAEKCILEGEVLVWSDKEQRTLDFHKIRKHVSRSGSYLGTALDSQPHPWEHLMIVFFDAMLIDNDNLLTQPYEPRRKRLAQLVKPIHGKAAVVERQIINFSNSGAQTQLLQALAAGFAKRWEGFVLKPCDEPYVNYQEASPGDFPSCWFKLKKDYIPGLGDTADFAIVGAGRDATTLRNPKTRWTHFHIGCLTNKADVLNCVAKPRFLVLDAFQWGITESKMLEIQKRALTGALETTDQVAMDLFDLDIEPGLACNMSVVFRDPLVFEMLGSGFDKCPNRDYFQLRFPRLLKVHWDRDFKGATDFDELQVLAEKAMNAPGDLRGEVQAFVTRLEYGNGLREIAPRSSSPFLDESEDSDAGGVGPLPQRPTLLRTDTVGVLPSEASPLPPRTLLRSTTAPIELPQEGPHMSKATESMSSVSKKVITGAHVDPHATRNLGTNRKRQRERDYSQPDSEPAPKRLSLSPSASSRVKSKPLTENLPLSEITNSARRPRKRSSPGICSPPKRQKLAGKSVEVYIDLTESPAINKVHIPSSSANTTVGFTSTASTIPSSFEQTRRRAKDTCSSPPTSPLIGSQPLHQKKNKTTQEKLQASRQHDVSVTVQGTYLKPPATPIAKKRNPWYSPAETTTASATESSSRPTVQEPMRVVRFSPPSSPCARPASLRKTQGYSRNVSGISTPPISSPSLPKSTRKAPQLRSPRSFKSTTSTKLPTHVANSTSTESMPPIFFFGTGLPAHLRKPQTEDSQTVPLSTFSPTDILNYISDQKVLILVDTEEPKATAEDLHDLKPIAQALGNVGRGIEIWDWGGESLVREWWAKSKMSGRRKRRMIGMMEVNEGGKARILWKGNAPASMVGLTVE